MKAFVTKYALTVGVMEVDAEQLSDNDTIRYRSGTHAFDQYFHSGEWFKTRDEAVAKAEKMRANKLKSIEKQRQKLIDLTF